MSGFFYFAADTVPVWAGPIAFGLAGLVIGILLFVWDVNQDDK